MNKNRSIRPELLLALALVACSGAPTQPTEQFEAAEVAIGKAGAGKLPAALQPQLQQARAKLAAARGALQAGDTLQARRLAEQARADAELAIARGDAAKARRALDALQRGQAAPPLPPSPPPPPPGAEP